MDRTSKIFCFALMTVVLFACPFTAPPEVGAPQPSSPLPAANQSNASLNASPPEIILPAINASPPGDVSTPDSIAQAWAMISKGYVEGACITQARLAAEAQGFGDSVVNGCSCIAQESASAKSYLCSVSALDGNHAVSISCTKSDERCSISSEYGNFTYTFGQLQSLSSR